MKTHPNHQLGWTSNDEATMTDQSMAEHTDINIIVNQFLRTGQMISPSGEPIYGDFTQLPTDLRGFIEMGRSIETLKRELPEQLRAYTPEELFNMTNEQINAILKPPVQPTDTTETPK